MTEQTPFTFHADPSHGWLAVTLADVVNVGLNARSFTRYSFCDRQGNFYLEEDCDAVTFINAYRATTGRDPIIHEKHTNEDSFVRRLPRLPV